jgi:hypothetical protein
VLKLRLLAAAVALALGGAVEDELHVDVVGQHFGIEIPRGDDDDRDVLPTGLLLQSNCRFGSPVINEDFRSTRSSAGAWAKAFV